MNINSTSPTLWADLAAAQSEHLKNVARLQGSTRKVADLDPTGGPKPTKGHGQATKNYFQAESEKYQGLIQSLTARVAGHPGLLSLDGDAGAMLKVYQDQLNQAMKAYATAPDAPGLDIVF
ncbi:hypothetical protein LJR225_005058 [Phenylobacterium sp. LjRoot225]|uniref:hypothetical protein n=1 Tax=Phenylobacterium sp. LjRoot225 TaxID=3342285 RepID=UPI003ECD66A0